MCRNEDEGGCRGRQYCRAASQSVVDGGRALQGTSNGTNGKAALFRISPGPA